MPEQPLPYKWNDVLSPTAAQLEQLAQEYKLPRHLLFSALEPDHMPSYQIGEGYVFLVIRAYDAKSHDRADTVHELTRKLIVFYGEDWILTLHRTQMSWMMDVEQDMKDCAPLKDVAMVVDSLVMAALNTYELPIEGLTNRIDSYEDAVFMSRRSDAAINKEMFYLKRKVMVLRRLIKYMVDVTALLPDVRPHTGYHELQYMASKLSFRYDELVEMVSSLMSLNISMSDHRTNEAMRLLTVISVLFMPITFLAGVYGMNFNRMPELEAPYGYPIVLSVMAACVVVLYFWFKRRGWL